MQTSQMDKEEKICVEQSTSEKAQLPFYRLNIIDKHSNNISNADIANQPSGGG